MARRRSPLLLSLLLAAPWALAQKTQPYEGFLCCSLLNDGGWISDLAYDNGYMKIVPAGTPVKFKNFGRWRMYVEINGQEVGLGNDYSRTIDMDTFAQMYVPTVDPKIRMQAWPERIREAILQRKVMKGMTREQVIMALGHPSTSYNPDPKAPVWNYRHSIGDYQVFWTEDGRVDMMFGPPDVRMKVFRSN
jgi:hypothetical protein